MDIGTYTLDGTEELVSVRMGMLLLKEVFPLYRERTRKRYLKLTKYEI